MEESAHCLPCSWRLLFRTLLHPRVLALRFLSPGCRCMVAAVHLLVRHDQVRLPRPEDWRERGSLQVKLSQDAHGEAEDSAIHSALHDTLAVFGEIDTIELYNKGAYMTHPFAMVNLRAPISSDDPACLSVLRSGTVKVMGAPCVLKQRRAPRQHRQRETAAAEAAVRAAEAAIVAKRPSWQPEMLERYPRRSTTLDQATLVAELVPDLKENVSLYLRQRFPGSEEVCAIMFGIAERAPKALRVKELFETVEASTMIGEQSRLYTNANGIHLLVMLSVDLASHTRPM